MSAIHPDPRRLRVASHHYLASLGVGAPNVLPLLHLGGSAVTPSAIGCRLLILHALASLSFDLSRRPAVREWLEAFGLLGLLTSAERRFLEGSDEVPAERYQWYSESCLALCWVARVVDLDVVSAPEPEDMVFRLPRVGRMEEPMAFLAALRLRGEDEIYGALDTLYCLHWAIRQAQIDGRSLSLPNQVAALVERRHALEWVASGEPWDEIALDT